MICPHCHKLIDQVQCPSCGKWWKGHQGPYYGDPRVCGECLQKATKYYIYEEPKNYTTSKKAKY
jgi:predicted amidophosphoribosyltransferase